MYRGKRTVIRIGLYIIIKDHVTSKIRTVIPKNIVGYDIDN